MKKTIALITLALLVIASNVNAGNTFGVGFSYNSGGGMTCQPTPAPYAYAYYPAQVVTPVISGCPGPGYNWVAGYWVVQGNVQTWVPGYWAAPVVVAPVVVVPAPAPSFSFGFSYYSGGNGNWNHNNGGYHGYHGAPVYHHK